MDNMENRIKAVLYEEIEKELNEEYTDYKRKKLEELDFELERKRNEIVTNILNSIQILTSNEPIGVNVMIKVKNRIIMKDK